EVDSMNYKKTPSSCRSTHVPSRKSSFLVGQRAFRRENVIFSSEHAFSDEKTLSSCRRMRRPTRKRDLLVGACVFRRGNTILLSEQLFETISLEAQKHLQLGGRPIQGNFLVDITVRAAQDALGNQHQGLREEIVPFFADLNRTMYYSFCRIAERAGLAHKEPE